jgi:hypothetical protein
VHLPSKHEALCSNPGDAKKKKKENKEKEMNITRISNTEMFGVLNKILLFMNYGFSCSDKVKTLTVCSRLTQHGYQRSF